VDIFRKANTMATMADTKRRRTRRSFTDEYKAGAVRLVLDEGKTVAAAARNLGLTESSLRNWVERARADRTKGKAGLTTAEREELVRLRKDVRELRMERDVPKKPRPSSRRTTCEVRVDPDGEGHLSPCETLSLARGDPERLLCVVSAPGVAARA
jgi:transposase